MLIPCPYCRSLNSYEDTSCGNCRESFGFSRNEIDSLASELSQLRTQTQKKLGALDKEIGALHKKMAYFEEQKRMAAKQVKEENAFESAIQALKEPENRESVSNTQEDAEKTARAQEKLQYEHAKAEEYSAQQLRKKAQADEKKKAQKEAAQKRKAERDAVPNLLEELLLIPFAQFSEYVVDVYEHYKQQKKLAVFFLTIGGVAAMLFAFGFLMRYTSDTVWEISKIGFTLATSAFFIHSGITLPKKEANKFKEFGSALIGLAITVNFLLIYFLSESPITSLFRQPWATSMLLLANTLLSVWLAMRYDTKIVLVLSLLGGAFAPFYLPTPVISSFYLIYLWMLCAATIWAGWKINWKIAGNVAFWATLLVNEMLFFYMPNDLNPLQLTINFLAFAILFFFYGFYDGKNIRVTLQQGHVFILAANLSLFIINIYSLYSSLGERFAGGLLFTGCAAVFVLLSFGFTQLERKGIRAAMLVIAGVFGAVAIPLLLDRDLAGICWAIEAVALIYLGFIFRIPVVRKEAYIILGIAFLRMFMSFSSIAAFWGWDIWTDGYVNLLGIGAVLMALFFVFNKFSQEKTSLENGIHYGVFEGLSFWSAITIWITLYFFLLNDAFPVAFLLTFVYMWWGVKNKLKGTEYLGFAQLFFLFFGLMASRQITGSLIFGLQPLFGKLSMLGIAFSFWLLRWFYEDVLYKWYPDAKDVPKHGGEEDNTAAEGMVKMFREIFYFGFPLFFLPTVNRLYTEFMPLALWVSLLVGLVLNEVIKRSWIRVELFMLTILSSMLLLTIPPDRLSIAWMAVGLSLFVLFGFLFYKKGHTQAVKDSDDKYLFAYSFYHLALCVFLAHQVFLPGDVVGFEIAPALLLLVLVLLREAIPPMYHHYKLAYRLASLLWGLAAFLLFQAAVLLPGGSIAQNSTFWSIGLLLAMSVLMNISVYRHKSSYPHADSKDIWRVDLFTVHLINALVYMGIAGWLFPGWNGVFITILLVVHAIILLFNSALPGFSKLVNLSVLFFVVAVAKLYLLDMTGFEMVQKIIVFMVIGALMLISAFMFVKFRDYIDKKE